MSGLFWYEVWVDEGLTPPYVLLLLARSNEKFEIYDPIEKRTAFVAQTYEAAKEWLLEDEYTSVDGRMMVE